MNVGRVAGVPRVLELQDASRVGERALRPRRVAARTLGISREVERHCRPGSGRYPDIDSPSERAPMAGRTPSDHRVRAASDTLRL